MLQMTLNEMSMGDFRKTVLDRFVEKVQVGDITKVDIFNRGFPRFDANDITGFVESIYRDYEVHDLIPSCLLKGSAGGSVWIVLPETAIVVLRETVDLYNITDMISTNIVDIQN